MLDIAIGLRLVTAVLPARAAVAELLAALLLARRTVELRLIVEGLFRHRLGLRLLVHLRLSGRIAFLIIIIVAELLRLHLLLIGLGGGDNAEIMLGELIIALRHHDITGGLGIAAQLKVFVRHGLGGAAHFDVRPVALVNAAQRIAAHMAAASTAATGCAMTIAPTLLVVVLTRSHMISIVMLTKFLRPRESRRMLRKMLKI